MNDNSTHIDLLEEAVKRYGLKQRVASVRAEMRKQEAPKPGLLRQFIRNGSRIAAALILLLGIIGVYQYITLTHQKLYNSLYEPYSQAATRGSESSTPLAKAFQEDRLTDVIFIFNNQVKHSSEDYFLVGNAYLKSNDIQAAISSFQSLLTANQQSGTHRYEEDAEYYLALSYLANNEVHKALPLFEQIHKNKYHSYHDKISSLFLLKLRWLH